jgi:hypothetical protein
MSNTFGGFIDKNPLPAVGMQFKGSSCEVAVEAKVPSGELLKSVCCHLSLPSHRQSPSGLHV